MGSKKYMIKRYVPEFPEVYEANSITDASNLFTELLFEDLDSDSYCCATMELINMETDELIHRKTWQEVMDARNLAREMKCE